MNCIDEQILQKYIDGECTGKENIAVELHLSVCLDCKQKHTEMNRLSSEIKGAINSLNIDTLQIPVFKNKETRSRDIRLLNRNFKLIAYSLSAACILIFVLLFVHRSNESPQRRITIVQSIPAEVDANRPASDQDFVIEVFDGKGQRSEYFINKLKR